MKGLFEMSNLPKWLNSAVFYQIYPQSFKDTNGDGIGDINGIIEKLDYIRDLGCNAIWINPCFKSPFRDAGYDISDYYSVAERYGTNEDLKNLFEEAHKNSIHVLLDLVPGHTSIDHPYFIKSALDEKNEFTDRYVWTESVYDKPGEDHISGFSERNGCCVTNYFSHQPALNYGYYNPKTSWQQSIDSPGPRANIEELKNIMRFWLKMGCDGFRVDMASSLVKGDKERLGVIRLWKEIREFIDIEFPEAAIISEWGEPQKSIAGGFHMDFILPFMEFNTNSLFRCDEPYFSSRGKGTVLDFIENFRKMYSDTNGNGLICIPTGSHDCGRIAESFTDDEMKLIFAFILSMPGAPFIYYGDEIGMKQVKGIKSVEGGYNRTGGRSPMQWNDGVNCGFSSAAAEKLYIPVDPNSDRPTVKKQLKDEKSLLSEVKKLVNIRNNNAALQSEGMVEFIGTDFPLIYRRRNSGESVVVIINPLGRDLQINDFNGEIIYSNNEIMRKNGKISIPSQSFAFIKE